MSTLPGMAKWPDDEEAEKEFLEAAESLARTILKKKGSLIDEAMEQVIKSRATQLLRDFKEAK